MISCSASLSAQIWSEEFDAGTAPNPAVWSYDVGNWGWGNQELQNYTSAPENVCVDGGHLVITARQEPSGAFTSGRIRTQDKFMFQYGTVEARIKIPDLGDGLWPAFWTLGNNFSSVGWPHCGEIDVLEMGSAAAIANGVINRRVYSTAHWQSGGGYASYGQHLVTSADLDDDFHIWRMEWTPTAITTYVDGQQIWVMTIANPQSFGGEEFHAPHFFILNLAVGGAFTGIFAPAGVTASLPAEYRIDYVRVYDNGHTILGGSSLVTASSTAFGAGCPSSAPLTLGGDTPVVGSAWLLTATQIHSSSPACLFWFGVQAIPGGVSLDPLGGLGCFAYTNANLGFIVAPVIGGNNSSVYSLTLPPVAALIGYQLTAQATAASPTIPLGIATSNGVTGVLGI
ncbi:MAG TPA: glycoside hydrolase family 16 protein [Planctomycetes bacterium]|nr:glycoside hydrolase family 16 protein [Planctomycetota bacterium]